MLHNDRAQAVSELRQQVKSLLRPYRFGRAGHIVDAPGGGRPPRRTSSGRRKFDEQAREEARRTGRATANAAVAEQAGRRPAWPAVAKQAGQPARAQADHLADAARTKPLGSTFDKWRPIRIDGAPLHFYGRKNAANRRASSST